MGKTKYRFEQIAINCTQKKIPTEEDNAGYIGLEHLESGSLNVTHFGSQVPLKGEKLVMHKGDVLLGKRNAYLRRAAVCPHDGIFSAHGMVLQPKEDVIDKSFFPLFISSDYFFDEVIRISVGSLSPTVNWKDLKDVVFELPDLEEQKRLAKVLWSINDSIEAYKKLLLTTDDLVKSQFIEMFGDPNESKDSVKLETAFTIRDDLRKPINDSVRSEMHENATIPYYGANGQVDLINQYLMDCTAICIAEDCGSYGAGEESSYIVTGKSWVNNHAHVLIPNECCDINYAHAYFRILDMTAYVSGSTRLKLTQGKMKEIPIVLPTIDKQKQFASFVEQIDKSKFYIQKLKQMKITIWQKGGEIYANI